MAAAGLEKGDKRGRRISRLPRCRHVGEDGFPVIVREVGLHRIAGDDGGLAGGDIDQQKEGRGTVFRGFRAIERADIQQPEAEDRERGPLRQANGADAPMKLREPAAQAVPRNFDFPQIRVAQQTHRIEDGEQRRRRIGEHHRGVRAGEAADRAPFRVRFHRAAASRAAGDALGHTARRAAAGLAHFPSRMAVDLP